MNWRRKISNRKRKTLSGKTHTDSGCLFLSLSLSNSNISTRCRAALADPNQDRLSVHSTKDISLIGSEGCQLISSTSTVISFVTVVSCCLLHGMSIGRTHKRQTSTFQRVDMWNREIQPCSQDTGYSRVRFVVAAIVHPPS